MRACDCGFQSLRENFDTTTAAGEMVLYTVANIAQFERRQVSERVSANLQARAARGLYNGGRLPLGYKLIPEKPGYLEIDKEAKGTLKMAFTAFLKEGTLAKTAKWLNANDYKVKREVRGGNRKPRLGYFTIDNLHWILTNKSYTGARRYKVKGEIKETKAVWPAIIDQNTFDEVQKLLKSNRRRKQESEKRFPFLLTGLVECADCKERMVGKSAHGNGGKIPYYEYSWAVRRDGCLLKPAFNCKPFRVLAKKLEPAAWEKVMYALNDSHWIKEIVSSAQEAHKAATQNKEARKIEDRIKSINEQIDVLAERLAELPKSISPAPIYKQMEKLEAIKVETQEKLGKLSNSIAPRDIPAPLKSYEAFIQNLAVIANKPGNESLRTKPLQKLVHKIQITSDGLTIHYRVGRDYIEGELAQTANSNLFLVSGSNSLTMY